MLQGPKHARNPTAPAPPADALWRAPPCLQAQQREAVLARLIDDDQRSLAIGGAGSPEPHVAHPPLPWVLPPVPAFAMDQVMPFDFVAIR
jgi:hypothetical protein